MNNWVKKRSEILCENLLLESIKLSSNMINFIQKNKGNKLLMDLLKLTNNDYKGEDKLDIKEIDVNLENKDEIILDAKSRERRMSMRTGKVFRRLLTLIGYKYSDSEIEELVNLYKSYVELLNQKNDFELVSGHKILDGYRRDNYYFTEQDEDYEIGSLGKSCMTDELNFLGLYTSNKNIRLLILYDTRHRIIGRALVWKLDKPNITYMDRIYVHHDYDTNSFIDYAIERGWAYKKSSSYGYPGYVFLNNEKIYYAELQLQLNKYYFEVLPNLVTVFPYVDTIRYLDPETGVLSTNRNNDIEQYLLDQTDGDYTVCDAEDNRHIDVVTGNSIEEGDAVYSIYHDGYLDCTNDDVVRLDYRYSFTPTWTNLKYDVKKGVKVERYVCDWFNSEHFSIVYCEKNDNYYSSNDAAFVLYSEYKNGATFTREDYLPLNEVVYSKKLNSFYKTSTCTYIDSLEDWIPISELEFSKYNDDYILRDDAMYLKTDWILRDQYDEYVAKYPKLK